MEHRLPFTCQNTTSHPFQATRARRAARTVSFAVCTALLLSSCATDTSSDTAESSGSADNGLMAGVAGALLTGFGIARGSTGAGSAFSMLGSTLMDTSNASTASALSGGSASTATPGSLSGRMPGIGTSPAASGALPSSSPQALNAPPPSPAGGTSGSGYGGGGGGSGNCPATLAHLAPRLPEYSSAPDLMKLRNVILTEDLNAAFRKAIAAGNSPAQAASSQLKKSQEAEASRERAKQCIVQVSTSPNAVIASLENGSYDMSRSTIQSECAKMYVGMYYGAVAMKEVAVGFACRAPN